MHRLHQQVAMALFPAQAALRNLIDTPTEEGAEEGAEHGVNDGEMDAV